MALGPALKRLAGSFAEATGLAVHLDVTDDLTALDPDLRHTLYRGAQEGLTNVQKHAAARAVWLELAQQAGEITLRVRDDGRGPAGKGGTPGFGLHGLRERAAQLGGDLNLGALPTGGSELTLTLPVTTEEPHA